MQGVSLFAGWLQRRFFSEFELYGIYAAHVAAAVAWPCRQSGAVSGRAGLVAFGGK